MTDQQTTGQEQPASEQSAQSSALRDNIARKGKNAYYFAHAHKANGPVWDGKEEPKLLSKTAALSMNNSDDDDTTTTANNSNATHTILRASKAHSSTFDFKSNITSYAFSDEGATVKLYITMEGVGDKCTEEDVSLDHTPHSFCLTVRNYNKLEGEEEISATEEQQQQQPMCLSILKLTAEISKAKFKLKKDRVVLILHKADKDLEWHTINDKGATQNGAVV